MSLEALQSRIPTPPARTGRYIERTPTKVVTYNRESLMELPAFLLENGVTPNSEVVQKFFEMNRTSPLSLRVGQAVLIPFQG